MQSLMNTKAYSLVYIFMLLFAVTAGAQNDTILYYSFSSNCAAPPTGWTIQNVDGSCTWRCSDGGITQNNHTSQGCSNAANDWLISPRLALNGFKNEVLNFNSGTQYSGGAIAVLYSTNYTGAGSPSLATWTALSATFPGASGNVNLSGIVGDSVYVAFQYTSTGNATGQAARWTILDIIIKGTKSVSITNPASRNIDSTSAILGAEVKQSGTSNIVERGIIWSTTPNPTLLSGSTKITKSGMMGVFDTLVSGLPSGTLIYFRGYAFNATDTAYTGNTSFYTLAKEPVSHVTNFTATTISNRAIVLNWTPSATAHGYIILQKIGSVPVTTPADATPYVKTDVLGDAIVADTIYSGTAQTDTIRGLLTGTRYYFTIHPFTISNNLAATLNYLTAPVIPSANDSTWGAPYSGKSDVRIIAGSESNGIPSIQNTAAITTATDGEAVLKLAFRDGGNTLTDADDMPTVFMGIRLYAGVSNGVSNWQNTIQSVALFDDSTGNAIGTITVNSGSLFISGLNIAATDNNYRTATLRLSLKSSTPLTDNAAFHFQLSDSSVATQSIYSSSQIAPFYTSSDSLKNQVKVSATKIRITQQPASVIEAGTIAAAVLAELTDVYNNIDLDTNLSVNISASGNNLLNAPVIQNPFSGKVSFSNLTFTQALDPNTLFITAGNLPVVKSQKFKVRNSAGSDIIATPGFAYASNIAYQQYTDTIGLTTANTVPVLGLTLREGGQSGDADTATTLVTSLKFSLTNYLQVKTAALFDSTGTKLGEVPVTSATVLFSGLNITVLDNGSKKLIVAVTFRKQVTDNMRIQLKVTEALTKTDTASSGFAAVDAGGAASSSYLNENRISVTATKLRIVQQPSNTTTGAVMYPAVSVEAIDTNNNKDLDGRIITVATNKSTLAASATIQEATSPATGRAVLDNLIFTDTATRAQLTLSDGTLSITSDTFNIIQPVWYRSIRTGDWDSVSTWEYSTDTGNAWLPSPAEIPYALKHSKILIRSGHTVTMRGSTAASRTLDETTIEANAVLVLPINADQQAVVNDGYGADLTVYGTLRQINNNINGGIQFLPAATALVKTGGIVELAANGYANDWAGNPGFGFEDGAIYLHNTSQSNSIGNGICFPNANGNSKPVFRIGSNNTYPPALVGQASTLTVNGILEIASGKTFTVSNDAQLNIRNGITGTGNLTASGSSIVSLTADAILNGIGSININDNALLEVTATSTLSLTSDKTITTNNNKGIHIKGVLNTTTNRINGSATVSFHNDGILITAHTNGVKGSLNTSGAITLTNGSSIVLNNTTAAQQLNAPSNSLAGKLIIYNPFGIWLNDTFTVASTLNLASGSLYTGNNGLLQLAPGTTILNAGTDRFISGRILATFASNTTISLGKNMVYAPVSIATGSNDTVAILMEYFPAVPASLDTAAKAGNLKRIAADNLWYIEQVKGNAPVSVTVPHQTNFLAGENIQDLRLATWTNNNWVNAGPASRNATAQSITSDPIIPNGYFAIAIDKACSVPPSPVASGVLICNGTVATVSATTTSGNLKWYDAPTGGTPLFEGNTFITGNLFTDTNLYAEASQFSCVSPRTKVAVTVVPVLPAPVVSSSLVAICKNNPAMLSASAATGTIRWYSTMLSTDTIASGPAFATGSLASDTVFYVAVQQSGCLGTRIPVEIDVKTPPQQPFTQNISVCKGNPATVMASSNQSLRWYTTANATQSFSSAAFITINPLQSDTTLYVDAFDGMCASPKVAVTATSLPVPQVPQLQTLGFACSGEALTLEATNASTIRWFYAERDSLPAHTGTTFNTGVLNRNSVFFADAFNGSCASARLSIPVSVVNKPAGFSLLVPTTIMRNDSALVQLDGPAANEYTWHFGPDALTSVKTGRGPHYVQWHTTGIKTVTLTAANTLGTFGCETVYDTTLVVTSATGLNEASALDASLFNVYPNPANDLLNIHLELKHVEKGTIHLLDMLGRTQWEDQIIHSTYETSIPVNQLPAGIYTLSVEVNGKYITQKIVISKQ